MVDAIVEEIHRELLLARDAVAKDDEYAVRYHFKQAYAYGIDIPGFIEHAAADTDDAPTEVRRLRNALQGALVCPREERGDLSTKRSTPSTTSSTRMRTMIMTSDRVTTIR